MIDRITTYLAPILNDTTFTMRGIGQFRSPKGNDALKTLVGIIEDSNGDYPKMGIDFENTGYLRLTDNITPVTTQRIGCGEFVYRVRVPFAYVVAYTDKDKSDVINYMMTKVSEIQQAYFQTLSVDKEAIQEQERIPDNLYRLIKITFNLEFQYAYNGECPVTITC